MASKQTLKQALKHFLSDDNLIDRLEADALYDLILQDGKISPEEKQFLIDAIEHSNFEARALKTLQALVEHHQRREAHRA